MKIVYSNNSIDAINTVPLDHWTSIDGDFNLEKLLKQGILIGMIIGFPLFVYYYLSINNFNEYMVSPYIVIVLFFCPIAHEIFHLLFTPNFLTNKNLYVYILPKYLCLAIVNLNPILAYRFIILVLAPFIALSVIPLLVNCYYQLNEYIIILAIFNLMGCGGDLIIIYLVLLRKVPFDAQIIECKNGTYWYK